MFKWLADMIIKTPVQGSCSCCESKKAHLKEMQDVILGDGDATDCENPQHCQCGGDCGCDGNCGDNCKCKDKEKKQSFHSTSYTMSYKFNDSSKDCKCSTNCTTNHREEDNHQ